MIIIDTNVISEAIKPGRNSRVVSWLDAQAIETLFFTAINLSELCLGIEISPAGKRREALASALNELLTEYFSSRILPFDEKAALVYGAMVARARIGGSTISVSDGQIGAIASSHSFSVATHDTAPFIALGVPIINPWEIK